MVENYKMLATIFVLFTAQLIIASNANSVSVQIPATFDPGGTPQPFAQSAPIAFPLSSAGNVHLYNEQNSQWLLTCPTPPDYIQYYNPSIPPFYSTLFSPNQWELFGDYLAAGNFCQLPTTPVTNQVTISISDHLNVPPNGPPTGNDSVINVNMMNAGFIETTNIGYSPSLLAPNGNFVSTSFDSLSYIFQSVPVHGQEGLWTWAGAAVNALYIDQQLALIPQPELTATDTYIGTYSPEATCTYSYTLTSSATLDYVDQAPIPFPVPKGNTDVYTNILPYIVYNTNITNPDPSNEFNTQLSYDIFSPNNYANFVNNYQTAGVDPFTLNSLSLFFSSSYNTTGNANDGNLLYFARDGIGVDLADPPNQSIALEYTFSNKSVVTAVTPPTSGLYGQCPDSYFAPDGPGTQGTGPDLTLDQVVACGEEAGFSGGYLITIVSMAYQESGWDPGDTEAVQSNGGCAAGILQEGHDTCPQDSQDTTGGYDPTTCSTYAQYGWSGVYYNPTCAFQWAADEFKVNGFWAFWGSYRTGAYCNWAPNGFKGVTDPIGPTVLCSGANQNQEDAPWASVCPGNVCATTGGTGSGNNQIITLALQEYTAPYCEGNPQAPVGSSGLPCAADIGSYSPAFTTTSGAFDCSGLVQWIYAHLVVPILLPRTSQTQFADTAQITPISQADTEPGDLVFFNIPEDGGLQPGHVAICMNSGCTTIIEESGPTAAPGNICNLGTRYCNTATLCPGVSAAPYYADPSSVPSYDCIMEFGHVVNAPTGGCTTGCSTTSTIPGRTVNWTGITVNSIAAIPSGYVFVLGNSSEAQNLEGEPQVNGNPAQLTPQQQEYQEQVTSQGDKIFILKVIPRGYLNTTLYNPNYSVLGTNSYAAFKSNWTAYWGNVMNLQALNVTLVGIIPVQSNPALSTIGGFFPMNISVDNYGDVFMTGYDSSNNGWIVEITNTIGGGKMVVNSARIYPSNPPAGEPTALQGFLWPEIAVSPTGGQVYLADLNSGYIPVFNGGNLQYQYALSLSYDTDSPLLNSELTALNPQEPPDANVLDYFENGGLYGIHAYQSNGNYCTAGAPGCSPADVEMAQITQDENSALAGEPCGNGCTVDELDKVAWIGDQHNANFHHPLAIQDVNGYLYVLDYWAGITGEECGVSIQNFGGTGQLCATPWIGALLCSDPILHILQGQSPLSPCTGQGAGGVDFGILALRVINSSGVDVPIQPTYYNDLWYFPILSNHVVLDKVSLPNDMLYPPYGWVISANLDSDSDPNDALFLCGGGPNPNPSGSGNEAGNYKPPGGTAQGNPTCYGPDKNYPGSFRPIGPYLYIQHCSKINLGIISFSVACSISNLLGASMSVSFNNTVSIFLPAQEGDSQNWGNTEGPIDKVANPNYYTTLLFVKFDPENYTHEVGGLNFLPFTSSDPNNPYEYYKCYTNNTNADVSNGGYCLYRGQLSNIRSPIYLLDNPFEYDENIGSWQTLTVPEVLSSDLNPSSPTATSEPNFGINTAQFPSSYGNIPAYGGIGSQVNSAPTTINSALSNYLVLPYEYSYTVVETPTITSTSAGCTGTPPAALTTATAYSGTLFNTSTTQQSNSNAQPASVESGASYAESASNTSSFYQPALTGIIAPPTLFYSLLTNREFGKIYINSTYSPYTNTQGILNATTQYTYVENIFTQGANPGYAVEQEVPVTPSCLAPSCAAPLANINNAYVINNTFANVVDNTPLLVNLFDWYKLPVNNWNIFLTLNGSEDMNSAYGYHRIVYVYNDRFNNTIYMPLDVDIANITQIHLNVNPVINSTNANQTLVEVNGTAFWVPTFSTNEIPLKDGYIYLYYDANLNTIGYNALDSASTEAVQTCVFANTVQPNNCDFANPIANGLQYNAIEGQYPDGSYYINPNITTYHTAYNSLGGNECSPPANSLLYPANQLFTLCNIYNINNFATDVPGQAYSTSQLSPLCPMSADGNIQYCEPLFNNGTGYCTPQLGLFDIATTNASGYFSTNIVACGFGFHDIIAQYYGTPGPEPIIPHQSPISLAANPSIPNSESLSFNAFNYSWAPIQATQQAAIGTILLNIGNISAPLGVAVVVLLAVAGALIVRHRKANVHKKGKAGKTSSFAT